jgi:acyl dehydratase
MSLLADGKITPQALDVFRSRLGKELRISWQFNELASREAIRNFAYGIGDENPLWLDSQYAAKSRYKGLIAPPSWYYSVFPTFVQQGLPGVHAFHSGNDWFFLRPVRENMRIKPRSIFTGFEEKESKFSGKTIIENQLAEYYDESKNLLASAKSWLIRAERGSTRKKGKYRSLQLPHPWSEDELAEIEEDILKQSIRGKEPRFWEDVNVDDELPPLIKGPLGLTDEIAFIAGSGAAILKANESALRLYRDHPSWGFRDVTFAMEPIAGVHWNKAAANSAGLPD